MTLGATLCLFQIFPVCFIIYTVLDDSHIKFTDRLDRQSHVFYMYAIVVVIVIIFFSSIANKFYHI